MEAFLEKYRTEILEHQHALQTEIKNLTTRCNEIDAMIDVIEKKKDKVYESFSPLEVHHAEREKIASLRTEGRNVREVLATREEELDKVRARAEELSMLLKDKERCALRNSVPQPDRFRDELQQIADTLLQDPMLAKTRLEQLIAILDNTKTT